MISISRILCLLGRHRRSRGHARRVADGFQSRCRGCGIAMRKGAVGGWHVDTKDIPVAAPLPEA